MSESNNNNSSKIKENLPFIFIFSVCLFVTLFAVLRPYYYRLVFNSIISDGNNKEVEALLDDSNFIQYATLEQGQKAIDIAIKTNRDNIDSKLALFDTASFKKFGNKELGVELSDYILETALKLDDTTKFKLLEDLRFINNASIEQIQKSLDVAIKTNRGNIDSKLALFDTASFKKFGNNELGRELSDSILETALKLDNAARFKLLEDSRFVSHASKEQVQKVILPILENFTKDDRISRYKLLENDGIKPFWNDNQPQSLLKNITESFNSKNIEELYEFLDKSCFKQYGTTEIGEAVVASMTQIILKSSVEDKIKFLSITNVKQYISKRDRKSVIDSIADFPTIFNLNTSQLDKFFFEICNQQEIDNAFKKLKKQNKKFPDSFLDWAVSNIMKISNDKTKSIASMLENNDSAKTYIAKKAYNTLSDSINGSYNKGFNDIKIIMDTFQWVFGKKDKDLLNGWEEGIEAIRQVDKNYGNSGYSTIRSLKNERDNIPKILQLRGYIAEYQGTYPNPQLGNLECYLVSSASVGGYYYDLALLYTCETTFKTKGSFEIFVQKINIGDVKYKNKNLVVFVEEPLKNVFRFEDKYERLTNQINRLEATASIYENSRKQTQEAIKSVKEKLFDSFYNIRIQTQKFEKHRVTSEREAENYLKSFFASNKEFMNYIKGFSIYTDNTTIQDNQKCYLIQVYENGIEHTSTVGWYYVYENGNIFDSINEKWLVSNDNYVSNSYYNSNLNNKISSKISPKIEKDIPGKRSVSEIPNNITYKKYTNVRFGYSIDYPDFMIPNEKSDNGQKFYFDTKTYISVYANNNIDNTNINDEYLRWKQKTDDYNVIKKNWFVCSGTDESNQVYYMKKYLKNNVFYSIYFYYPVESLKAFDEIITKVTKSFKY